MFLLIEKFCISIVHYTVFHSKIQQSVHWSQYVLATHRINRVIK